MISERIWKSLLRGSPPRQLELPAAGIALGLSACFLGGMPKPERPPWIKAQGSAVSRQRPRQPRLPRLLHHHRSDALHRPRYLFG
jgi:hypothetical protein